MSGFPSGKKGSRTLIHSFRNIVSVNGLHRLFETPCEEKRAIIYLTKCYSSFFPPLSYSSGRSGSSHLPLPVSIINPIRWQFLFQKIFGKLLHGALTFRSVLLPALFQMLICSAFAGSFIQRQKCITRDNRCFKEGRDPQSLLFFYLTHHVVDT